jgi:hypothetical protein
MKIANIDQRSMARFVFIANPLVCVPKVRLKARIPEIALSCKPDTKKDVAQVKTI